MRRHPIIGLILFFLMCSLSRADPLVSTLHRGVVDGLEYTIMKPLGDSVGARVLVMVHGVSRNHDEIMNDFRDLSDAQGLWLLAPIFDRHHFDGYQRLGVNRTRAHGRRADHALLGLLNRLKVEKGANVSRVLLFGHSGGAQFVHRFALIHPDRVDRYVASAAGWYTLPKLDLTFPHGFDTAGVLPGRSPDLTAFLSIPACVLVGADDTRRSGPFNASERLDRLQGRTRLARAQRWVDQMNSLAMHRGLSRPIHLKIIPRIGHDFTDVIADAGARAFIQHCLLNNES